MKVFWIDLFSGAGGTTTGIHLANNNNVKVVACVNHDVNAIKSHKANYPECNHFTEDVRDLKVIEKLSTIVTALRYYYPDCKINLWASLECTNYSNAKGGQARDADSRTLAYALYNYVLELNPDYVYIENVREFMSWGPLDDNGKPISKFNGIDYIRWIKEMCSIGNYYHDWKLLNAADFGAYTSRNRYFGVFAKKHLSITWPEQTHSKNISTGKLFISLPKWKPVKDILDFNDEGKSIFERKKPLSTKTISVIANGIKKAIQEDEDSILFKYYGNGNNLNSINSSAGTITTKDRFAKIHIIFNQYKNGNLSSFENPLNTITTTPKSNLVSFIMNPSHGGHTTSVNNPSPVVIARQDKAPLYLIQVMNMYDIIDIKMRMLKIPELKKIQGFPDDYILIGTKTEQKKFIGNSVHTYVAKQLAECNYNSNK